MSAKDLKAIAKKNQFIVDKAKNFNKAIMKITSKDKKLIASVQGGFSGLGIGESTQKYFFLPEAHTDFIFSIYLEETGAIGFLILFACYLVILWRLFKLAENAKNQNYFFNSLIITSFALLFFIQTSLNIFVNLGVIPTKGLTLPFISYGRSSVIMNFIALAITLRASWEFRNKIK